MSDNLGLPSESEWTRPLHPKEQPFMARLMGVVRQEVSEVYKKQSQRIRRPERKIDTNVDIPISGLTGFKRRL